MFGALVPGGICVQPVRHTCPESMDRWFRSNRELTMARREYLRAPQPTTKMPAASFTFPRNLVIAGKLAEAAIVEEYVSLGGEE